MFDNVLDKESKAIYLGNPSIKSVENSTLGGGGLDQVIFHLKKSK